MNKIITVIAIFCFSLMNIKAQGKSQCAHCNMTIKDELHKAAAEQTNEKIEFDAIECLINFFKIEEITDFKSLKVVDYETGELIDAKSATYLKTKAIPSPMGANLSAFKTKEEAIKVRSKKGGEIYTWEEIIKKFENSDFGALDHNHHNHYRPDSHAPIGIAGDHLHPKGGLMLSFRYMNMTMNGNRSGTEDIDNSAIFENFIVAPQQMNMEMYMVGLMYAPVDRLTLMAMQNFIEKEMDLSAQMMMNGMKMQRDFSTSVSGLGDLMLGAMYGFFNDDNGSLHLNANISLPLGSIKETDDTPMRADAKLPYTMQLGSGTIDYTLGATFKKEFSFGSFGTQLLGTYRTDMNSENYRFGNLFQLNTWGAYVISSNLSLSARFLGTLERELEGIDSELNPMMVTTANTKNYGGEEIKSFLGLNFSFSETSSLKKVRFALEAGAPIYENNFGVQMDEELSFNVGLKYDVF